MDRLRNHEKEVSRERLRSGLGARNGGFIRDEVFALFVETFAVELQPMLVGSRGNDGFAHSPERTKL